MLAQDSEITSWEDAADLLKSQANYQMNFG